MDWIGVQLGFAAGSKIAFHSPHSWSNHTSRGAIQCPSASPSDGNFSATVCGQGRLNLHSWFTGTVSPRQKPGGDLAATAIPHRARFVASCIRPSRVVCESERSAGVTQRVEISAIEPRVGTISHRGYFFSDRLIFLPLYQRRHSTRSPSRAF